MRYRNLNPQHRPPGLGAVLKWGVLDRVRGQRRPADSGKPAATVDPDIEQIHSPSTAPRLTWIGHSSFLLQLAGVNVMLDPVFAERVGWVYPRHGAPGLRLDQLPRIDVILVTHSHFDHLDRDSIEALPRTATVVCGRRLGPWFVKRGFARVIELDWWESAPLGLARVTFVPARHWSKRGPFDTNRTLWGGFIVTGGGAAIYHAGDTAWFDGFADIGRRFPGLDAALLPIGGYEPAWFMDRNHINPEQAGQAFLACGARSLVPAHWGTFQLTDEPLREPIERLRHWWSNEGPDDYRKLLELKIGETAVVSHQAANAAPNVMERGLV